MQQNARLAINAMAQDMRMAGYNHRQKGPAFSPFTTATGHNAVTFKCYSGASGPGFFKTSYVMSGNSIKRIVNGSVKQVFGNIDSLSFVYRDNGGNTINSNPTVAVTDLPKIRRVDLTIVAKTARPDRDYGLNGGYRTLTLTSSVSPRNMPD
jgi:hypothetical protein